MSYKVGTPIKITYQAAGNTIGLTDVTAQILDETESLDPVDYPDIVLTENSDVVGEYLGSFTPDAVGTWRAIIDSATKPGRLPKQYEVTNRDIDSLNDVSPAEVKAEAGQALSDYGVAKSSDIAAPPMLG